MTTCWGWTDSFDQPDETVQLPTQFVTADLDVDLGVYFPNPYPKVQAVGNPNQAIDDPSTDKDAYLLNATELPPLSFGYRVITPQMRRNYGTYELVELIRQVGVRFNERYEREFLVGDLSTKNGGTIRTQDGTRAHSSHRNGLDVDINTLHADCNGTGSWHDPACPVMVEENLELLRLFIRSGPSESVSLVATVYTSQDFEDDAYRFINASFSNEERYAEVLDYLQVRAGHMTHFHIRITCPDNSVRCPGRWWWPAGGVRLQQAPMSSPM